MNGALEMRRLYIVRTAFSNENQRESTEAIDSMTEKVTFRWPPETRKAIQAVRGAYRHKITAPCLNFYGLSIVKEADKEGVFQLAEKADQEMKKISPDLRADVRLIPLYVEKEAQGEVYQAVLAAIQGRIYSELLGRLRELAKLEEVPKVSRTALLKLCDRLKVWNVIDDPSVGRTLEEIKLQISNDIFKPVMVDLEKELADLKSRGAYLEFDETPLVKAVIAIAPPEALTATPRCPLCGAGLEQRDGAYVCPVSADTFALNDPRVTGKPAQGAV